MEFTLECKLRPADSKPNALRRSGQTPAVLYGHDGAESVSLTVDTKTAEMLLRKTSLNNTLINLTVTDLPWNGKAVLREVHSHPWKGFLYHLSFFSIGSQATLEVVVPVHLVGESPGVKLGGGSLDLILSEISLRCAPDVIPQAITIDVSELNVGDALQVQNIPLPEGVVAVGEPDRVVVMVSGGGGGGSDAEAAA
jgi:large subunit ribosomal protein L25